MSGIIKSTFLVLIVVALMATIAPRSEAAISCGSVVSYLRPCLPYLRNQGPLGNCCGGAKRLNAAAATKGDRQSVCGCLKSLAGPYKVNPSQAASLAGKCGISLPYKVSPSTDCSKVN